MTDTELQRRKAICEVAGVDDIGNLSDGFHTFNGLYEQRMILFAALVNAYKDKSWKSYRHEDGEYCFGGGWFIVGIDTPEGSYTYHYENRYWNMFDCVDLPRAKHWDGHTEADAETRLMSLEPEIKTDGDTISRQAAIDAMEKVVRYTDHDEPVIDWNVFVTTMVFLPSAQPEPQWIPCSERLPKKKRKTYWVCTNTEYQCECRWTNNRFGFGESDNWGWSIFDTPQYTEVIAWMPLPEPYREGES